MTPSAEPPPPGDDTAPAEAAEPATTSDPGEAGAQPGTRERLLTAATALFAESGFAKTGVREICEAADTNVASVRYHFGDKDGLYRQVLLEARKRSLAPGGLPALTDDPHADLAALVRWFLLTTSRIRGGPFGKMMLHEIRNPTETLDFVVEQGLRPIHTHASKVIGRVMAQDGVPADDPSVRDATISVIGMCVHRTAAYPVITRLQGRTLSPDGPTAEELEDMARAIIRFALNGLRHAPETPNRSAQHSGPEGPKP